MHLCWTSVVMQVYQMIGIKHVVVAGSQRGGRNWAVRTARKSFSLMKDLVCMLIKREQLVVDPCAGNFAVAKACMMFPKHQRLVGCETDAVYINALLQFVGETFDLQGLNVNLDMKDSSAVVTAAWIYVSVQRKESRQGERG